jgi:hypothetical protein
LEIADFKFESLAVALHALQLISDCSPKSPLGRAEATAERLGTARRLQPFGTYLFEELPQILKHGIFFVRPRAIGEKELLAQVQCLPLYCCGTKPVLY